MIKSNKYNNPGTDVVTLESEKHKTIYLIDHSADRELEDNLKRGDGFGIRRAYNLNKITKNDIQEIIRSIAPFYDYSSTRLRNVLQTVGITEEHLRKFGLDDGLKRLASSDNAFYVKDGQSPSTGENGYRRDYYNSSEQGNRNEGVLGQNPSIYVTEDGTECFLTPNGEVYGFVDKNNNIYLDETKISPEHPLHEFSHIWDRAVMKIKYPIC